MRQKLTLVSSLLMIAALVPGTADAMETAEATVTARANVARGGSVVIENLLGSVHLVSSTTSEVKVEAHVLAEGKQADEARALADSVRIERVVDADTASFHVVFPVDQHPALRVPKSGVKGFVSRWTGSMLKHDATVDYDGRSVQVGAGRKATGLAVELTVTLPFDREAVVDQRIGSIDGRSLRGSLRVVAVDGEILFDRCLGSLRVETEHGDVRVASFQGEELEVTSRGGNVELKEVRAARATLRTETGTIRSAGLVSENLQVESASGDVHLGGMEPRRAEVRTGSGKVDLATNMTTLRDAVIQSESGDVTLRVGELSHFDLEAETKSGEVKMLGGMQLDLLGQEGQTSRLEHGGGGSRVLVSALGGNVTVRPYDGSRMDLMLKN